MDHVLFRSLGLLSSHYIMQPKNSLTIEGSRVDAILVTTRKVKETLARNNLLHKGMGSHSLTRKLVLFSDEQARMAPLSTAIPVDEKNVLSNASEYVFSRDARHKNEQVRYLMENQPIFSEDNVPMSYLKCDDRIVLVESIDENYDQTSKSNPLISNMSKTFVLPVGMKITDVRSSHYKHIEYPIYPSTLHVIGEDGSTGMVSLTSAAPYFAFSEFLYTCRKKEGGIDCDYFPLSTEPHKKYNTGDNSIHVIAEVLQQEVRMESRISELSERFYADIDNRYIVERECHPYFTYSPHVSTNKIVFSPRHRILFGNVPSYICPVSHHISRGCDLVNIYGRKSDEMFTYRKDCRYGTTVNMDLLTAEITYMNSRMKSEVFSSSSSTEVDATLSSNDMTDFYSSATELVPSIPPFSNKYSKTLVDLYRYYVSRCNIHHYMYMPMSRIMNNNPHFLVTFNVEYKNLYNEKHAAGKDYSDAIGFLSIPVNEFQPPQFPCKPTVNKDNVPCEAEDANMAFFHMMYHTKKQDYATMTYKDDITATIIQKCFENIRDSLYKPNLNYDVSIRQELEKLYTVNEQGNQVYTDAFTVVNGTQSTGNLEFTASNYHMPLVHSLIHCANHIQSRGDDKGVFRKYIDIANDILSTLEYTKHLCGVTLSYSSDNHRDRVLARKHVNADLNLSLKNRMLLLEGPCFVEIERQLMTAYAKGIVSPSQIYAALYSRCQEIDPMTVVSCLKNNIGICTGVCLVKSEVIEAHDGVLVTPGAYELYTGLTKTVPYDTNDVNIQTDVKCSYVYTKNVLNHGSLLMQHLTRGEIRTDSSHFVVGNMSTFDGKPRNAEAMVPCVTSTMSSGKRNKVRKDITDFLKRVGSCGYYGSPKTGPVVDGRLLSQASVLLAPCVVSSYFFNRHVSLRGFDNLARQDIESNDIGGDGFHSWNPYSSNTLSVNNRCYGVLPKPMVINHCLTARSHRNQADIFKFFMPHTRMRDEMLTSIVHDHRLLSRMTDVNSMMKETNNESNENFDDYLRFCKVRTSSLNAREATSDDITLQRVSIPFCYTSEDMLRKYKEDLIRESQLSRVNREVFSSNSMIDNMSGSDILHDTRGV